MSDEQREERLKEERKRLESLKSDSTIFDFEATGDPPTKYVVTFRGKGINRSLSSSEKTEPVDLHRVEIRLPYAFPDRPPDIRWLTPVHHPNISFSGMIKLRDVGLPWEEDLSLDIICERLWDMARLAYYDEERATNYAARNWLAEQTEVRLPVDQRPLRDQSLPTSSNVVKYERRSPAPVRTGRQAKEEVFYIGDDTPPPKLPRRTRSGGDDDTLYIGYE